MTWLQLGVTFALVWWTLLFAILPLWTRPIADPEEKGHFRGAPEHPMLGRKILLNTILSILLTGVIYAIGDSGVISFRSMLAPPPG